ncbi:MAG: hypothetical protein CL609_25300 [Anaerolineaceae bacterium]|nr:hypothetical protein [Anaerolineaceae bacterium]
MLKNNSFWDFYWETRLQPMENLGKRAAILSASRLIRSLSEQKPHPLRLLELGCGEGQVIGTLLDAHSQVCSIRESVGVDYNPVSITNCRRDFPGMTCVQGDFTKAELLNSLGKFDLVILVNALHEVFSDSFSPELGEVDVPVAKQNVETAFARAVNCISPGGWVVLFDGLEPSGDPNRNVSVRFYDERGFLNFNSFVQQYHPFKITYGKTSDPFVVTLSQRDFTRYITKSIFLGKQLWKTEQLESYQYFTEEEFDKLFSLQELKIKEFRKLTMNEGKWHDVVEILTPEYTFPDEHILILAQK